MNSRRVAIVLTCILFARLVGAEPTGSGSLTGAVSRVVQQTRFATAVWAIEARRLDTGALLYALNESKSVAPASTIKLVTTAAALDAFGPDATLRTTIETAARMDGMGRILGDVYLVGGGDPTLWGSYDQAPVTAFDRLAESLVSSGVRRIEGRLIGHEGLFQGPRRGLDWAWSDLVWYYGAEASALQFNNGAVHIRVMPGKGVGDPVLAIRNPASAYYELHNSAVTALPGSESDLVLERDLGSNVIRLSGSCPAGGPAEDLFVAIEDPARFAVTVFAETLASRGIAVAGVLDTTSLPLPATPRRILAAVESPPMARILRDVNRPSHNIRAEMLVRLLGHRVKGEGSAQAGLSAMMDFMRRMRISTDGWALHDGCGLSPSSLVTARGIVHLLAIMHRHGHASVYKASLPVAGESGTLRRRLKGAPTEKRVWAKSGLIAHTNALAGYALRRDGVPVAFAIFLDRHTAGSPQAIANIDEICRILVGERLN
ncbi:MAG: D-alanyl-D-alanine carboxypeptidase/D-alanyl-D-alanine-endopeptidase [Vicinamibacteria bacterium]|nr:D-alanyl-D-alanine carboxypeptidase/D-alanyl-D-alanine-endopeptidase [Vicinamibacteria bacterium]